MDQDAALHRLAAIGDVHAEDGRLGVALDSIARLSVDAIVCTGDIVDGHGDANRCCTLLLDANVQCVRGNHDRWLFTGILRDIDGATALTTLTTTSRSFLSQVPATIELPVLGGLALLCHGIGPYDLEKITEFDTDYSLRVNRTLQEVMAAGKYRLMINGHSHTRLIRRVASLTIINAGTLCQSDPGFLVIDFGQDVIQWHSIADGSAILTDESVLGCSAG
jgi:predicted phosphodiesterase